MRVGVPDARDVEAAAPVEVCDSSEHDNDHCALAYGLVVAISTPPTTYVSRDCFSRSLMTVMIDQIFP